MTFLQQQQGKIQEKVRARAAAVGRGVAATTWTKVKLARLPRQHVMGDVSASKSCGIIRKRCSAGLCRDNKPKSPQRHERKQRLPRHRVRKDAATSRPSGSSRPAVLYTVQTDSSRTSKPVGGPGQRWLAEEVGDLAPQYCRPGLPAMANHMIRHDAQNQKARRLGASDLGLVPCAQGLARAFAWNMCGSFKKICSGSNHCRSYAVTA